MKGTITVLCDSVQRLDDKGWFETGLFHEAEYFS